MFMLGDVSVRNSLCFEVEKGASIKLFWGLGKWPFSRGSPVSGPISLCCVCVFFLSSES